MNDNKRNRFVYSFLFIILLIIITVMYASLASNFAVKMNKSDTINPNTNPIDNKPDDISPTNDNSSDSTIYDKGTDSSLPVIVPDDINWDIRFENIVVSNDSVTAIEDAYILETKTEVVYSINLKNPGEFYEFTVDVVNRGSVDAKLYEIIDNGLTNEEIRYLDYDVKYEDGTSIKIGDSLASGQKEKIKVTVKFKYDLEASDLPNQDKNLNLSYKLVYVEK